MNLQINSLLQDAINNFKRDNFSKAKILLLKILDIEPYNFDALNIIGVITGKENNHLEAINFFKKAQKIRPNNNFINFNLGKALSEVGNDLEAIKYYKIAINLDKNHLGSWLNFANSLSKLERYDEALIHYDEALKLKPDYFELYNDKALILYKLKRFEEALFNCDQALKLKPDFTEAYNNKALVLYSIKRFEEALFNCDQALKLKPDFTEAYSNKGSILRDLRRYDEALFNCDQALKLEPNCAEYYYNRGSIFQDIGHYEEALFNYDQALKLKPDYEYLLGTLLLIKMFMCNWQDLKDNIKNLSLQINQNKKSSLCHPILSLIDSPLIQRKSSEIWVNDKHPFKNSLGCILKSNNKKKIKIGYYSSDFREHPTTYLLIELFELHDKNQFELFGFYFGPKDSSKIHKRVSSAFNKFFYFEAKSDKDIAQISRDIGIDIAVDLNGFIAFARTDIFSYRAAPIQVNYLGYPGTIAADYIDYIIADLTIIPQENQKYYSEKIVYLPNSYQVNSRTRPNTDIVFTKNQLGLTKDSFVFCCFNNIYKITPNTFDTWVRILKTVKNSVLLLLESNSTASLNLRNQARYRGLDPNRLIFVKRTNLSEHLARHRVADLFLDTLPCNAHTTTSDALWAGLPVLTCMGESFASRVAASLLNAIELPELITTTQEQYEALAIELATTPEKLRSIKKKLERNKLTTALFDTPQFTKHIEAAYKQMYERYQADLPPNNIYIKN